MFLFYGMVVCFYINWICLTRTCGNCFIAQAADLLSFGTSFNRFFDHRLSEVSGGNPGKRWVCIGLSKEKVPLSKRDLSTETNYERKYTNPNSHIFSRTWRLS
jgi:hypothetical protein